MRIGIMQPYFFPYIGYWQLINAVDKYVIFDDVNYIKRGWINKNRILLNGKAHMINIILNGASQNKLVNEVKVSSDKIRNNKLLKTINQCYKKAPYYNYIYPLIDEIISFDEETLSLYLANLIKKITSYLEIETELMLSSDIVKDNNLKGQDRIIDICKNLQCSVYYNAIGGKDLYSNENFYNSGVMLKFLKTETIEYKQFNNEFVSNLSIIDVMMFNSKDRVKEMLECYTLE